VPPVVAFQVPAKVYGDVDVVDERFVEDAHHADVAVHVWTSTRSRRWPELLDLDVDGLVSDRPTPLASAAQGTGLRWDGVL
jgi:glycerophosphoryl diester phosphodiesterase